MVEADVYVKAAIARTFVLLLACFYGIIESIKLTKAFLQNPLSFFRLNKRTNYPARYYDTRLGEHKFAQVNGIRIHYVANGKKGAPLVLMVHGWPECWYSWRNQLVALADKYYVVAFDLRGSGQSSKPTDKHQFLEPIIVEDIRGLVEHLGYEKAYVVGHDWGAGFSYAFATTYPSMVEKLVISNFPYGMAQKLWLWTCGLSTWYYLLFYQLPFLPLLANMHRDMWKIGYEMKSPVHGIPDDKLLNEEDIEVYKTAQPDAASWTSYLNYPRASASFAGLVNRLTKIKRNGGDYPRIKPKTLFLWGAKDLYIPTCFAYLSRDYCDNGTVKLLEATHWVQQHQPEAYTAALKEFFAD